ncbi:MAG: hypothetical protein K8Q91_03255 [Candidatus Vogelbacteria bacterium]|nr:hypothetical protein [Candidatus Vogelbacteria bacterium]
MSPADSFNDQFHRILVKLPNPHRVLVVMFLARSQVNFTIENECRLIVDVFINFLVENYPTNQDLVQTLQEAWLKWCNKPINPNEIVFRHTPELWETDHDE